MYKMLTAAEAIEELFKLKTEAKRLDFTFDDIDVEVFSRA